MEEKQAASKYFILEKCHGQAEVASGEEAWRGDIASYYRWSVKTPWLIGI